MKKTISLLLTLVMLMTTFSAFAETAADAPAEEDGILSVLGALLGGAEDGEESGLTSVLGGLKEKLGGEFDLSALLEPLRVKLRSIREIDPSVVIDALKEKINSLLGGVTRNGEDGGLSSLLSSLFSDAKESEGGGLSSLLSGLFGSSDENAEGGGGAKLLSLLGGLLGSGDSQSEGIGDEELYSLLGMLFGEGEGDNEDFDLDSFLEAYRSSPEYLEYLGRLDALTVHLNEEYATLEKGDVQIVTWSPILNFENEDPNFELGYYSVSNFVADGVNLKLVSYGGNMELLTYAPQEDGTFMIVEAIAAEEGEGFEDSVRSMCDAFGVPFEDYIEHKNSGIDFDEMWDLLTFLEENPEYERIEYKGELLTAEELDALTDALIVPPSADEAE